MPRALLTLGYCLFLAADVCLGLRDKLRFGLVAKGGAVKRAIETPVAELEQGCPEQLARFFPEMRAVRIPVHVTALRSSGRLREATLLEFGGRQNAIFVSTLPLEFDDCVHLECDSAPGSADATVVAVQYHDGRKAVAVRFNRGCCDWVTQP